MNNFILLKLSILIYCFGFSNLYGQPIPNTNTSISIKQNKLTSQKHPKTKAKSKSLLQKINIYKKNKLFALVEVGYKQNHFYKNLDQENEYDTNIESFFVQIKSYDKNKKLFDLEYYNMPKQIVHREYSNKNFEQREEYGTTFRIHLYEPLYNIKQITFYANAFYELNYIEFKRSDNYYNAITKQYSKVELEHNKYSNYKLNLLLMLSYHINNYNVYLKYAPYDSLYVNSQIKEENINEPTNNIELGTFYVFHDLSIGGSIKFDTSYNNVNNNEYTKKKNTSLMLYLGYKFKPSF